MLSDKDNLKPCKAGQMRVPITTYRCINNATFHTQLQNKLKYIKPRSSRSPSRSSRKYFTPKSKSRFISRTPKKTSIKSKRPVKLSFLEDIKQGRKLKHTSPKRNLSFLQQIKQARKLKHISPKKIFKKSTNPFLEEIERGHTKLKRLSSPKLKKSRSKSKPQQNRGFNTQMLQAIKKRRNVIETDDDEDENDFMDGRKSYKKK